jgi:hypothetical protein
MNISNEERKMKREKSKRKESKKGYLGAIFTFFIFPFYLFFCVTCSPKKPELPEPDFSQSQKFDHTVKFNNETIPMTVYYSRDADGDYYVMDGLVFEYDGKKHSVGADNLQKTYFEDPSEFGLIEVSDYNFDNYMDIAFLTETGRGSKHTWYEIYIYNQNEQKYEYHAELSKMPDIDIDNNTQTLRSILNSGYAGLLFSYSEFNWENGQLTLINRKSTDYNEDADTFILTTGTLTNGVWNEQTQTLKEKDLIAVLNGTPSSNQELALPPQINLFQYVSQSSPYAFPNARIWGWSNNGKVAYSIGQETGGRGGKIVDFVVFDLVSDKAVFELKMDSFNHDDVDDYVEDEALHNLYEVRILNALKTHNIIVQTTEFSQLPIRKNNMVYNSQIINAVHKEDEYGFFENLVTKYTVEVTADDKKKIIGNFEPLVGMTGNVYVCGYILSPFENRALIVLAEEARGYEGNELRYRLSGCHLGVGFN